MPTQLVLDNQSQTIMPTMMVNEAAPRSLLVDPIFSTEAILHLDKFLPGQDTEPQPLEGRKLQVRTSEMGWNFSQSLLTNFPLIVSDLVFIAICYSSSYLLGAAIQPAAVSLHQYVCYLAMIALGYLLMTCFLGAWKTTGVSPVVELKNQIVSIVSAHLFVISLKGILGNVSMAEMIAVTASTLMCGVVLYFARSAVRLFLVRQSWWGERLVVVGAGNETNAVLRFLDRSAHRGLKPIGVVDSLENFSRLNIDPAQYLGNLTDLCTIMKTHRATWCIASLHDRNPEDLKQILHACDGIPNVVLLNNKLMLPTLWSQFYECAGLSGVHIRNQLLSPVMRGFKRLFDLVVTLAALTVAGPVIGVLAVMVKICSPGPVFYSQGRVGRDGQIFRVWKLRSMVPNADLHLQKYLDDHPELKAEWVKDHKLKNDPRIIPVVGKFIRATSLDELPQLWNVLTGEMSVVGPRPIVDCANYDAKYIQDHPGEFGLYCSVRPGITGLWQVSGRNLTVYEDRIRMDAYYVRNWSPWLDYFIMLRTVRTILFREGAY